MPIEAYAQSAITIAPQAVGGISCLAPNEYAPGLFGTPLFSGLIGVEGSLLGVIRDSNLAFSFGTGYDFRSTEYQSTSIFRANYVALDLSIRNRWFQVGVEAGIPVSGNLDMDPGTPFSSTANLPKADLNTFFGIFAAAHFPLVEWSKGKLNLVMRLDYEILNDLSDSILTPFGARYDYSYYPGNPLPTLVARIGLSYEFNVWQAMK
jgi:hypothetical protein